jgi:hypothetical protein
VTVSFRTKTPAKIGVLVMHNKLNINHSACSDSARLNVFIVVYIIGATGRMMR